MNHRRAESRLDAWAPFVGLAGLIFLGGAIFVGDAVTDPSGWHWFLFGLPAQCFSRPGAGGFLVSSMFFGMAAAPSAVASPR